MEDKGIPALAQELGFEVINFEDLAEDGWTHFNPRGTTGRTASHRPRRSSEAEYLVSTCCLKTHGFGGHFSMSHEARRRDDAEEHPPGAPQQARHGHAAR